MEIYKQGIDSRPSGQNWHSHQCIPSDQRARSSLAAILLGVYKAAGYETQDGAWEGATGELGQLMQVPKGAQVVDYLARWLSGGLFASMAMRMGC